MAARFPSVSDEDIFALKKEAIAANTARATIWLFGFTAKSKIFFPLEFAENPRKCSSKKTSKNIKIIFYMVSKTKGIYNPN